MKMEHEDATRIQACTRYLMGSLSPAEAAAFEEHYFTCPDCAEELKAGSIFGGDVRAVFHEQAQRLLPASPVVLPQTGPGWLERVGMGFALPFAATACVALMLFGVVIYQNAVYVPGLRAQVADLTAPQSLAQVALKISRGPGPVAVPKKHPFWVAYFNLPTSVKFPASCEIESSSGVKLKPIELLAPAPGQPSAVLLRRSDFTGGLYKFRIRGSESDAVLATYELDISPE